LPQKRILEFCDLLGLSAKKANECLGVANLMETHNVHKTLGPDKWDALKQVEYVAHTGILRGIRTTICRAARCIFGKKISGNATLVTILKYKEYFLLGAQE
jgi:hypothetical protein